MSDCVAKLLAIGGAHVDRLARLSAPHIAHTSNPAVITETVGGGCFNAARAARRFGTHVSMLSARGGDAGGVLVEEAMALAGIADLSSVHLDRTTSSYTAIMAPDGELITAIADMALYDTAISRSFKRAPVQKAASICDAILCDANLSATAISALFDDIVKGHPVYAMAISATKAPRWLECLPNIACLFMNRFEAAAITGLPQTTSLGAFAEPLHAKGLRCAVITAGGEPALFYENGTITLIAPPPIHIVDVTGAGDCLAGTMVAALLHGSNFIHAAKLGLAAASLTAARQGAFPVMSLTEIEALAAIHEWNIK